MTDFTTLFLTGGLKYLHEWKGPSDVMDTFETVCRYFGGNLQAL